MRRLSLDADQEAYPQDQTKSGVRVTYMSIPLMLGLDCDGCSFWVLSY